MTDEQDDMLLAAIAKSQYTDLQVAELAARDVAGGRVIRCDIKDDCDRGIIIGHMLVAVFVGGEASILDVMEAIRNLPGAEEHDTN